jgi:hypothetical protein
MAATGAPAGTPIVNQNAGLTPQMGIVNGDGTPTVFFFRWLLNTRSGAGKQTPWLSDIDAAGFNLDNLGNLTVSGSITFPDGTVQTTAPAALVPATRSVLGGVKIGANVTVAADGTISVAAPGTPLVPATATVLGGVKIGANITVQADGTISVAAPGSGPQGPVGPQGPTGPQGPAGPIIPATATVLGGVKIGANITVQADGTISVAAPGGSQTPWTSNINGGGFSLSNVNSVTATVNITGGSLIASAPGGGYKAAYFQTAGSARWTAGANGAAESGSNAGSDFFIERYSDAGASLGTAFSILRASGNVGIGTTAPAYPLDVIAPSGQIRIATAASGVPALRAFIGGAGIAPAIQLDAANVTTAVAIGMGLPSQAITNGDLVFGAYPGSGGWLERMRIANGGNVGIGTASPGVKLDVVSNDNTDSGGGLRVYAQNLTQNATYSFGGLTSTYYYKIQTNTAQNLALQPAGGNVGVGTSAPAYALDVAGDVNASGAVRVKGIPLAVAPRYYFASQGGAANAITVTSPDGQQPPPGSMISVLLTNNTINANQTNTIAFNGGTPHSIISSRSVTNLAVGYALNCVFTGILDTNNGYVRDISQ